MNDLDFHSLKFSSAFSGSEYSTSAFGFHCVILGPSFLAGWYDSFSCPMRMIRTSREFYCARNYCKTERELYFLIHSECRPRGRYWQHGKSRPTGIKIPDNAGRHQPLHGLRYDGRLSIEIPHKIYVFTNYLPRNIFTHKHFPIYKHNTIFCIRHNFYSHIFSTTTWNGNGFHLLKTED
jgi:hypothetical protein